MCHIFLCFLLMEHNFIVLRQLMNIEELILYIHRKVVKCNKLRKLKNIFSK